jgi:hypothetical protein
MCDIDLLDLVATIRESRLDPGLAVPFEHRILWRRIHSDPKAPRVKEGRQ